MKSRQAGSRSRLSVLLLLLGVVSLTAAQDRSVDAASAFFLPLPGGGMALFEADAGKGGLRLFRFYGGAARADGPDLQVGDVLTAIDGRPTPTPDAARKAAGTAAGSVVELSLLRDGERRTVRVAPAASPPPGDSPEQRKEQTPEKPPAEGLKQVEFFLGEWEIESRSADGSRVVGRARSSVRYILDGTAMQADYRGLDPAGNVVFRGTTVRTWVPSTGRFAVHWAMANLPGYTYIDVEYRDGELHGDGRGFDAQGEFVERYRYFDISDRHYSFEMSRSYDGGETWAPFANLRATKREESTR